VTLRPGNFPAWKISEVDMIHAKDILEESQTPPPIDYDEVEEALWKEKKKILYTRISASLHYKSPFGIL
jgi:hypothetical protein